MLTLTNDHVESGRSNNNVTIVARIKAPELYPGGGRINDCRTEEDGDSCTQL